MNLMHTVVTTNGESKPDRVRCNTCKSERSYRPPKKEKSVTKSKSRSVGGDGMTDRDEDLDLDQLDVSKVFLGDEPVKKKPKAKAKAKSKKTKDEAEARNIAKGAALPLSMQSGTADDLAQFESKYAAMKNNLSLAKPYKASERFAIGDMIDHKTFGIGFVVTEIGQNKLEMLFREGRKLLVTAPK
jgi:hypothetical protein